MNKPKVRGVRRLIDAFFYSINGFRLAFKSEEAFRLEIYLLPIVFPLALYLAENGTAFLLYFGSYLLILFAELINSAIESIVDRIGPEIHPLSGQAKDIGSALVLLAIILALIVWGVLTIEYL